MGVSEDKINDLKNREKKVLQMGGDKAVANGDTLNVSYTARL